MNFLLRCTVRYVLGELMEKNETVEKFTPLRLSTC